MNGLKNDIIRQKSLYNKKKNGLNYSNFICYFEY